MNFAFLVHPLGNETDRVLAYIREVDLPKSFGWDMASFIHDMHVAMVQAGDRSSSPAEQVRVIDELPGLVARSGKRTDGRLYEIPMDSFAILEDPDRALEYILAAIRQAADWGARSPDWAP